MILKSISKKKNDFINEIRGKKGWINFGKDNNQEITIIASLKYKMVIVHGGNIKNGYNAFIVNDKLCFLDLQQGEIIEYY